jgi:hypothetical protein
MNTDECPVCKSKNLKARYKPFSMDTVIGSRSYAIGCYCSDCGVVLNFIPSKIIKEEQVKRMDDY